MESKRRSRSAKLLRFFGNLLTVVGVLVLLGVGAAYGYGFYERHLFETEQASRQPTPPAASEAAGSLPTPQPSEPPDDATPQPGPTIAPRPLPAVRMLIPSIGVDSTVVEAQIKDGEWQVPKFVVGHLEGTAYPGESGNGVYSGHVESISSGNVFANLAKVRVGDSIYLFTAAQMLRYQVTETKVVKNTDVEVLYPTPEPRITLITCTGSWDVAARDYTHRLVVVATPWKAPEPQALASPSLKVEAAR